MTSHHEKRTVPYTPDQLFELVADVKKYPEFLPWCVGARIRSKEERLVAEELEHYFRVPADNRDLNYDKYFSEGKLTKNLEEYNSFNTHRLSEKDLISLLASIGYK